MVRAGIDFWMKGKKAISEDFDAYLAVFGEVVASHDEQPWSVCQIKKIDIGDTAKDNCDRRCAEIALAKKSRFE